MPRVGFEHTIPVFERAKTVHALDRAATAIGLRDTWKVHSWPCVSSILQPDSKVMYAQGWATKLALAPRPLMIYCALIVK
jgi:hypothetical protein